jgi:hypothetical protein
MSVHLRALSFWWKKFWYVLEVAGVLRTAKCAVTSCAAVAEQFASSNQILVRGSDGIRHFRRFASHRGLHCGRHNSVLEPRRGQIAASLGEPKPEVQHTSENQQGKSGYDAQKKVLRGHLEIKCVLGMSLKCQTRDACRREFRSGI